MTTQPDTDVPPALTSDQVRRLWELGTHEDKLFHDRLNFFSILELGLLAVGGAMYSKEPALGFFIPFTAIALLFTLIWLAIQLRQLWWLECIENRLERFAPEFKAAVDEFAQNRWWRRFSVTRVLALAIPILFLGIWATFFVWLLVRPATVSEPQTVISLERVLLAIVIVGLVWLYFKQRRIEQRLCENNGANKALQPTAPPVKF